MIRLAPELAAVLVIAQSLLGCGAQQGPACVTQERSLQSAQEKSTSGFSCADALGDVTGACFAITWLPTSAQAVYAPAGKTSSLSLRLEYVDAPIVDRSVLSDNVPHDPNGSDGCVPTVSTKLSVGIASSDGALDEQGVAEFTGYGKDRADFTWVSDASKLRGTFKLLGLRPGSGVGAADATLSLVGVITPDSESGSVVLSTGSTDPGGKSGSGLALVIARWRRVACPDTTTSAPVLQPVYAAGPATPGLP